MLSVQPKTRWHARVDPTGLIISFNQAVTGETISVSSAAAILADRSILSAETSSGSSSSSTGAAAAAATLPAPSSPASAAAAAAAAALGDIRPGSVMLTVIRAVRDLPPEFSHAARLPAAQPRPPAPCATRTFHVRLHRLVQHTTGDVAQRRPLSARPRTLQVRLQGSSGGNHLDLLEGRTQLRRFGLGRRRHRPASLQRVQHCEEITAVATKEMDQPRLIDLRAISLVAHGFMCAAVPTPHQEALKRWINPV